jgi:hypothetical protein
MPSNWIDKQFDELKKLAEERFAPLSAAETKMLRAAIAGDVAWCGPSQKSVGPQNDPFSNQEWGAEREIRADLLRWLCIDKAAEGYVDARGIRMQAATISGETDLSGAVLRFPLVLNRCRFSGDIWLISGELTFLDLSGSSVKAIRADRVTVKGNFFLKDSFTAHGEVRLMGAQIDGSFECDGGVFRNPPRKDVEGSGRTLTAEGICVKGNVLLRNRFQSEGQVWLSGSEIGGSLDCSNGSFKNPAQKDLPGSGTALVAENISLKGDVLLRKGFQSEGQVWLVGAKIGGSIDCGKGSFKNSAQRDVETSGTALELGSATVGGNVLVRNGFNAEGNVSVIGAKITGEFDASGGCFDGLNVQRTTVQRSLFWRSITKPENTMLDLQGLSIDSLVDDRGSWPGKGKFFLDGFVYRRIADGPNDSKSRLEWLNRQSSFTPQPYRQLAKVLREDGDDPGARHVLYEMEKRKHREARHGWPSQLWNLIFRGTIGYGIYPRRALWWLLLLIVLGWGAYWRGYSRGAITPTNKEAYEAFHSNGGPPPNYQHFSALVYSAEHCFPLVNLGQKEAWTPDPNRLGLARSLRAFRWCQILLGWGLATFFVAGVTGIARKD